MFATTAFLAISTFLCIGVSAIPRYSNSPHLRVEVTGPSAVVDADNLWVVTTVTNLADETVKLLEHPDTPLSQLPTDIFEVTRHCGKRPDFIGHTVCSYLSSPFVEFTNIVCRCMVIFREQPAFLL